MFKKIMFSLMLSLSFLMPLSANAKVSPKKGKTTSSKYKTIEDVKITAYCPCELCSEGYGRETSTGKYARSEHTIAVDPDIIPYGTTVIIDGKKYKAEDCGGDIKGNRIDIFMDTHEETLVHGVKHKDIKVKKKSK